MLFFVADLQLVYSKFLVIAYIKRFYMPYGGMWAKFIKGILVVALQLILFTQGYSCARIFCISTADTGYEALCSNPLRIFVTFFI